MGYNQSGTTVMVKDHPVLSAVARQVAGEYVGLWERLGVRVDIKDVLAVLVSDGNTYSVSTADLPAATGSDKDPKRVAAGNQGWKTRAARANGVVKLVDKTTDESGEEKRGVRAFKTRVANYLAAHPEMVGKDEDTIRKAVVSQPKQPKAEKRGDGRRGVQDGRRNNGRRKQTDAEPMQAQA